jgi:hypothetical protein
MSTYPQWFNAERASELVSLFDKFGNKCLLGHKVCSNPEHYIARNSKGKIIAQRMYDRVVADKVADFKDEDKALWHRERREMHDLGEPERYTRGRWNAISKDIYYSQQPTYVFRGLGVSAVTFKPVAKIRISSSYWYLYIDLPIDKVFKSKNAKRKAIRYNKLDSSHIAKIDSIINKAVTNYRRS